MIDDYRDLALGAEIQILSHALVDKYHREEIKGYKFQFSELQTLLEEIADIQDNNLEPVIQALWDKYPIVYGRLKVEVYKNISQLLGVANKSKARIYTYNQLVTFLTRVSDEGKPLEQILDAIIHNMRMIKGRL